MRFATIVTVLRQVAVRLFLPVLVLYGALVGLGLLVTRVLPDVWPLTVEDGVNRGLDTGTGTGPVPRQHDTPAGTAAPVTN